MIKRDYILNMIEQLIQRLQLLTGLIDLKDFDGAFELIDETMEQFFGWRSDFVNAISEEDLLAMLRDGKGRLDIDATTLLAVLVKAEGDVYTARNNDLHRYHRYVRALNLFLAAHEDNRATTVPPEWDHTRATYDALSEFQLPLETQERLYRYLRDEAAWADAESLLWEIADAPESDFERWQVEGEEFYQSLLQQSSVALQNGGFSLGEAMDGLADWRARGRG